MVLIAKRAGGEAPLAPEPDTGLISELRQRAGVEQLDAILKDKEALTQMIGSWTTQGDRAVARLPVWHMAVLFRSNSDGLPISDEVSTEMDSILEQRSLLSDIDAITPLVTKLAFALRGELTNYHSDLTGSIRQAVSELDSDFTWQKLDVDTRAEIIQRVGLITPPELDISSDRNLSTAVNSRPLRSWKAEIDAVSKRRADALDGAVSFLQENDKVELTKISVRRGTLSDESEVDAWLAEHSARLKEAVKKGAVIVD